MGFRGSVTGVARVGFGEVSWGRNVIEVGGVKVCERRVWARRFTVVRAGASALGGSV